MAQEKKYDVFISSKSEDYPIAEKVYDFLVDNGLTVFLASRELSRIGEAVYSKAVDAAIDGAHHMIVVTTSLEYLNSNWVRYEWTTFADDLRSNYKEGNLLTILGPKIQLKDLPPALRHKQSFPIKSYKENILDYLYKDKRIDDLETPTPKPTPKPTPNSRSTHKPIKKSWIWLTIAACAIVGLVIIGVRHFQQRSTILGVPVDIEQEQIEIVQDSLRQDHIQDSIAKEQARRDALPEGKFQVGDLMYMASENSSGVTVCGLVHKAVTEIHIPSQIDYGHYTYDVTSIGYEAFYDCKSLISITIPNSVTSIENKAFAWCVSLTSITIPNSVTSIGEWAFSECKNLTSITIPNSVTSIGEWAFDSCESLTSITIPNSVTSIGGLAFAWCKSLTSITIPNSVTSIGEGAFRSCYSLTSITIPNSVTSIGEEAFCSCLRLTSITIPNSVTSIGKLAFADCFDLTSIAVEKGNITYDSRENCNAIIETATNTLISGCQNTVIPNNVTSIGDRAFYNCSSLTSITIPNSVTSIGDMAFYLCLSLTSVTIPNSVTSIGNGAFSECENLTSITIPNSVTSIGDRAFSNCSSLKSIKIPKSLTNIGSNAFPKHTKVIREE